MPVKNVKIPSLEDQLEKEMQEQAEIEKQKAESQARFMQDKAKDTKLNRY